jgi:hypothetical protein
VLPNLRTARAFQIQSGMIRVTTVSAPLLVQVGLPYGLEMLDMPQLTSFSFPSLTRVRGGVTLQDLPLLSSIAGFPVLAQWGYYNIDSFKIERVPLLRNLNGLNLVRGTNFDITSPNNIDNISGLCSLRFLQGNMDITIEGANRCCTTVTPASTFTGRRIINGAGTINCDPTGASCLPANNSTCSNTGAIRPLAVNFPAALLGRSYPFTLTIDTIINDCNFDITLPTANNYFSLSGPAGPTTRYGSQEALSYTLMANDTSALVTNQQFVLRFSAITSTDPFFDGFTFPSVAVTVTSVKASFTAPTSLSMTTGQQVNLRINLAAAPWSDVTIPIASVPASLIIAGGNNTIVLRANMTYVDVTVTAGSTPAAAANVVFGASSSTDPAFNGVVLSAVSVTIVAPGGGSTGAGPSGTGSPGSSTGSNPPAGSAVRQTGSYLLIVSLCTLLLAHLLAL